MNSYVQEVILLEQVSTQSFVETTESLVSEYIDNVIGGQ